MPRLTDLFVQDLIARYLDTEAVHVIQGGAEETTLLLRERFDHIFYTGNGTVGRIIMKVRARSPGCAQSALL